jgi:hypothetical protein
LEDVAEIQRRVVELLQWYGVTVIRRALGVAAGYAATPFALS